MQYNFDSLPDRRSTESVKWHAYGQDVLPLWVADMDFVSPEPVIRALQERVAHGVFGYADEPQGLREAVVAWLLNRHNWQVSAESLVFIPGVVTGFHMAAHALVQAGEGILMQPPVYMPFLSTPHNVGGVRIEAPLTRQANGSYVVDLAAFERAIVDAPVPVKLFILCNPHNPVGRVFTREELAGMAEICLRHQVLICSDEIHADLIFSGYHHIPIAALSPEISRSTITVLAPSKTFNIAGLSCSVAVIEDPELRKKFSNAHHGLVHGVNALGLVAARAAYQEGAEWLDQVLAYLEGNRDFLLSEVPQALPGAQMTFTEGTYLAWIDCRSMGLGAAPGRFFLEHAQVAITEGGAFGQGGEGFVRLNFGSPRSMLQEALDRMHEALVVRA